MTARQSYEHVQTVCLLILALVAGGAALYWLRPVLVPLVLAIFVTYALSPLVDLQIVRLRFPRPVAIVATLLVGAALFGLLSWLVARYCIWEDQCAGQRILEIATLNDEDFRRLPPAELVDGVWETVR